MLIYFRLNNKFIQIIDTRIVLNTLQNDFYHVYADVWYGIL